MKLRNDAHGWGAIAQLLHWSLALLIIVLAVLGLLMQELPNSPDKIRMYALHKSLGLTALALVLLRLGWRLFDRRPPWPASMPVWERRLAAAGHALLYLLMLVIPLAGWLYNSAANFSLRWFNLFRVPPLSGPDPELKALALALHNWGFYLLAVLFIGHVAAALKHHYLDRDRTLVAMLPLPRHPDRADQEPPPR
jgi:cytochrome b561